MIISNLNLITDFSKKHAPSRKPLQMWIDTVKINHWKTPSEIKAIFASADFLSDNRIIFNIGGNKYRLVVEAIYHNGIISIHGVYTHEDYSKKRF